jgi:CrcB protein
MTVLAVAVGGAFGAVARYGVSIWMMQQFGGGFPWGTLAVNLVGCFLLGLLDGFVVSGQLVSAEARLLLGTGFLGALTTFSTFSVETIRAFEVGQWLVAGGYLAVSLIGGLALAALGVTLATKMAVGG